VLSHVCNLGVRLLHMILIPCINEATDVNLQLDMKYECYLEYIASS